MKLYWFMREPDGHYWQIIAAENEKCAWQYLAAVLYSDREGGNATEPGISEDEAREMFNIASVTDFSGNKGGEVASIFPLEVGFNIRCEPGGKISMVTDH